MKFEQALIKAIELKHGGQASLEIQSQAYDLMSEFVTLKHEKASHEFNDTNKGKDASTRQRKSRFMRYNKAKLKTQLAVIKMNHDKIKWDYENGRLK